MQVDAPNVIIEAVKQAEDSGDLIVRLYECARASARATLRFGFPVAEVAEVNLMEEEIGELRAGRGCSQAGISAFRDQDGASQGDLLNLPS